MPGQFGPEWGGQFDAESVINYRRNQVVNFSGISTIADDDGNIPNDSFDVTSSHVVRVTLEEDYALKFIEDVNNKIEDARKNKLIV